jgi:protein SCO1/2
MLAEDDVADVLGAGFRVFSQPRPDGSFAFDPAFVLVDGWGVVRGEYRYATLADDADKLIRHIGILGEELRNSRGAGSIAYEAAHVFLCYP